MVTWALQYVDGSFRLSYSDLATHVDSIVSNRDLSVLFGPFSKYPTTI